MVIVVVYLKDSEIFQKKKKKKRKEILNKVNTIYEYKGYVLHKNLTSLPAIFKGR